MEATHGATHINTYDRVKQATRSESERPHALRQAILSCRSGGTVSVIGVYGGFLGKFPSGAWMNRSITQDRPVPRAALHARRSSSRPDQAGWSSAG